MCRHLFLGWFRQILGRYIDARYIFFIGLMFDYPFFSDHFNSKNVIIPYLIFQVLKSLNGGLPLQCSASCMCHLLFALYNNKLKSWKADKHYNFFPQGNYKVYIYIYVYKFPRNCTHLLYLTITQWSPLIKAMLLPGKHMPNLLHGQDNTFPWLMNSLWGAMMVPHIVYGSIFWWLFMDLLEVVKIALCNLHT